jgi:hypothetical protein
MAVPDFQTLMLPVLEIDAERPRWIPVSNCYTANRGMVSIPKTERHKGEFRAGKEATEAVERGHLSGTIQGYGPVGFNVAPNTFASASHEPKIHHRVGDRKHGSTRIDTRKGERWFCTEREAQDNGWKHAGK